VPFPERTIEDTPHCGTFTMTKNTKLTPKATITFKNVDAELNLADKTSAGAVTLKHKVNHTTLGVTFTDATARDVSSLKNVVATVEQRFGPKVALTGTYAFDDKAWKATGSWEGKVASKKLTIKSTYALKGSKLTTEANLIVKPHQKATVNLDKFSAVSAKYSLLHGGITYEPSYNFLKKGFSISATKRKGNEAYKLSYDFKNEMGGIEWSKRPYKISVSAPLSHQKLGKATVALTWEQEFHI